MEVNEDVVERNSGVGMRGTEWELDISMSHIGNDTEGYRQRGGYVYAKRYWGI